MDAEIENLQSLFGNVVIVEHAHQSPIDGALVCYSTHNEVNHGDGWDEKDTYTSHSSGRRYHKNAQLPHNERFRCATSAKASGTCAPRAPTDKSSAACERGHSTLHGLSLSLNI